MPRKAKAPVKLSVHAVAFAEMLWLLRDGDTVRGLAGEIGATQHTIIGWLKALRRKGRKQAYISGYEDRYTQFAAVYTLGDKDDMPRPRRAKEDANRRRREANARRKLDLARLTCRLVAVSSDPL